MANTVLRDWLHESRAAIAYRSMRPPYPSDPQDGRIPQVEPSIVPLKAIGPVESDSIKRHSVRVQGPSTQNSCGISAR
jgi:hypothetical protein